MTAANLPVPGLWPVMLTAFTRSKEIHWEAMDQLTDWYIESGSAGLFTVCLSSEMYNLNPDERLALADRVVKAAAGRVPVIAAATFGETVEEHAALMRQMSETGVDAVVCLVNQLVAKGQPEDLWKTNAEALLQKTGDIPLGLYECPRPYHRVMSPELLAWAASTGRFVFLKETSGDIELKGKKIEAVKGTGLGFFNASTPTLLATLRMGAMGYSSTAANFYPELFAWLCENFAQQPETADRLQQFISGTGRVMGNKYPASAKKFAAICGVDMESACRTRDYSFDQSEISDLMDMREKTLAWHEELGI